LQIVMGISKRLSDYIFRDPEEGGSMLLWNASSYLPIYTPSYLERRNCAMPFVSHNAWIDLMTCRFGQMSSETIIINSVSYNGWKNLKAENISYLVSLGVTKRIP
jgi:hypothetical protein